MGFGTFITGPFTMTIIARAGEFKGLADLVRLSESICFCRKCGKRLCRAKPRRQKYWACKIHSDVKVSMTAYRREWKKLKAAGLV